MRQTLALVCLLSAACARTVTYEQATTHQFLAPGRYYVQCQVRPMSVAVQWVNQRAFEVCRAEGYDSFALESASATNNVAQWRDTYGNTHLVNREGYMATAVCR